MGTSQSKRDAPPLSPLIPPWADQDPAPPEPNVEPDLVPHPLSIQPLVPPTDLAPPRRYATFRSALGQFMASGDQNSARTALGRWSRIATGGSRAGASRISRATRTGGAAIAGLARAGAGLQPADGALNVRSLMGFGVDQAIDRIVDAFCPPGILDEDVARLAMGEALATALSGTDTFNPDAINANVIRVATLTFAAELVFVQVVGDAGRALAAAPTPAIAAQRELDLRSLIREVTDLVGTPLLSRIGDILTPTDMTSLISRLVEAVEAEVSMW